jgi:leader peptidase (prepilin peptidase)/N-methyltransferase
MSVLLFIGRAGTVGLRRPFSLAYRPRGHYTGGRLAAAGASVVVGDSAVRFGSISSRGCDVTRIDVFGLVVTFLFGAVFGSFLNVCIYRMPLGKSLIWPPSHCPKCFQPVGKWNIPIAGYFLVRGRCRECGEPFSIRYAAIEFLTGALLSFFFYVIVIGYGAPLAVYAAYAVLVMVLIAASFIDLDWKIIPQRLCVFGVAAGLIFSAAYPRMHGLYLGAQEGGGAWVDWVSRQLARVPALDGLCASLAGMVAGVLIIVVIRFVGTRVFRREAMGMGDAKLMAAVGAFLGWRAAPMVFLLAAFVGAVIGILSYLRTKDREIPLGPFLALGSLLTMLWGNRILHWWVVDLMGLTLEKPLLVLSYGLK